MFTNMWHLKHDLQESDRSRDSKVLFAKTLYVHIKDAHSKARKVQLSVTVEIRILPCRFEKEELVVRITDENDPFFLYILTVNEEDFHSVKSSQKLLVDFAAFPSMLADRLELCLQEELKDSPKFLLQLCVQDSPGSPQATLEVVQTDHYQHVVLLSLKLMPATDAFIKQYLSSCLRSLKNEKENLTLQLRNIETELREKLRITQEQLHSKNIEIDQLQKEHFMKVEDLKRRSSQEVQAELDKKERELQEARLKYEKERRDTEFSHNKSLQQLESKVGWLENQNRELQSKLYVSEALVHELQTRNSNIEQELQSSQQKLQETTRARDSLEAIRGEQEKTLSHWQSRAYSLEEHVKEKDAAISRLEEQLSSLQAQKRALEELVEQKENVLQRKETSLKLLSDDVSKGNDIIRKLQSEVQSCRTKLKKSSSIAVQQEETVVHLEKQTAELQTELDKVKELLKEKEAEITKLSDVVTEQKCKIEECENKIKTNNDVMAYLHRQLNENQGTQRFSPSSANAFPRSSYLNQNVSTSPTTNAYLGKNPYSGYPTQRWNSATLNKNLSSPGGVETDGRSGISPVLGSADAPPPTNCPLDPKYFERNPSKTVQTTTFSGYSTFAKTAASNTDEPGGQLPSQRVGQQRSVPLTATVREPVTGDGVPQPPGLNTGPAKQNPVPFVPVANRPRPGGSSAYFPARPVQT